MKNIIKKGFPLIILAFILNLLIVLKVFFSFSSITAGAIQGIAADSEDKLYIGTENSIIVFGGETRLEKIDSPSSHNYCFCIREDRIVISRQDRRGTKEYDLKGNYISESNMSYDEVKKISANPIVTESGDRVYELLNYNGFKPAVVTYHGKIIYSESLSDYLFSTPVFSVLIILVGIIMAFALLVFITDEEVKAYIRKH